MIFFMFEGTTLSDQPDKCAWEAFLKDEPMLKTLLSQRGQYIIYWLGSLRPKRLLSKGDWLIIDDNGRFYKDLEYLPIYKF